MSLESELCEYLDGQGILTFDESGTSGDTFIGVLPDSPDEANAIYSEGGPTPSPKFIEDERDIQFICRGTVDPRNALSTANDIYSELQGASKFALTADGIYVIMINGVQSGPIHIGRDDKGRHKYSLNLRVEYENTTEHRIER